MGKATQLLHSLGQSLWLDSITRDLLAGGTPKASSDENAADSRRENNIRESVESVKCVALLFSEYVRRI
jgi:hypothetical protein